MGKMSRTKGKVGEREVANVLKAAGISAQRGRQFQGGEDSPDVKADLPGWHIEVKRVECLSLYTALDQAIRDAGSNAPVVIHRKNKKPWVAITLLDDWLSLVKLRKLVEEFTGLKCRGSDFGQLQALLASLHGLTTLTENQGCVSGAPAPSIDLQGQPQDHR